MRIESAKGNMMILTCSMKKWLSDNYPELISPIQLGHLELFTRDMRREYLAWCCTEEGRRHLKNGEAYDEVRP